MCEFTAVAQQVVNPGEAIIFTETAQACQRGFVRHQDGTGTFNLSGATPYRNGCLCTVAWAAEYMVDFGANIAVPTGETVGEISVAYQIGGATVPATRMRVTPAAVEEFWNVSRAAGVAVWNGCCENFSIINTGTIPILVSEANLVITRPDLIMTM